MTILSQAQTIRDETVPSANTAERVGDCLVDIANALSAPASNIACGAILSAGSAVVVPDDQYAPIYTALVQSMRTSSAIEITSETTPDFSYFSGLTVGKMYKIDYSLSISMDNAGTTVSFALCNYAASELEAARTMYIENAGQEYSFSHSTMFESQGTGTVVLYMKVDDPAGATITVNELSITIMYAGDGVV
jgi:hypothetical protein